MPTIPTGHALLYITASITFILLVWLVSGIVQKHRKAQAMKIKHPYALNVGLDTQAKGHWTMKPKTQATLKAMKKLADKKAKTKKKGKKKP